MQFAKIKVNETYAAFVSDDGEGVAKLVKQGGRKLNEVVELRVSSKSQTVTRHGARRSVEGYLIGGIDELEVKGRLVSGDADYLLGEAARYATLRADRKRIADERKKREAAEGAAREAVAKRIEDTMGLVVKRSTSHYSLGKPSGYGDSLEIDISVMLQEELDKLENA